MFHISQLGLKNIKFYHLIDKNLLQTPRLDIFNAQHSQHSLKRLTNWILG